MDTQPEIERLTRLRVDAFFGLRTMRPVWKIVPVAGAAPGREDAPDGARPLPWWFRLLVGLGIMRKVKR